MVYHAKSNAAKKQEKCRVAGKCMADALAAYTAEQAKQEQERKGLRPIAQQHSVSCPLQYYKGRLRSQNSTSSDLIDVAPLIVNRVAVWESDMSHESRCVKEWFS
jgi:hypothetical protein